MPSCELHYGLKIIGLAKVSDSLIMLTLEAFWSKPFDRAEFGSSRDILGKDMMHSLTVMML